ncbi:MAG: OmpA family protein [Chitinophagaceae bacterium]
MKKTFLLIAICCFSFINNGHTQILKKIKETVKGKVEDKTTQKAGDATDKVLDGVDPTNNNNSSNSNNSNGNNTPNTVTPGAATDTTVSFKTYQNYDFVPGDTILFADDFTSDMDGEFPSHWNLDNGQAVVNKAGPVSAFFLTDGNYCRVNPLMKTKTYLTDPFTIEFDYFPTDPAYPVILFLNYMSSDNTVLEGSVKFSTSGEVSESGFPKELLAQYPGYDEKTYRNHWHHCAIIYKNNQLKCYVDQYRVLVVPSLGAIPTSFGFGGLAGQDAPIIFSNVRAASGGNMNMVGKKFTEAKIVTHGINFDVDKSTIKPESMGTLNMIVNVLKDNPELKFEIDGHTDNSGTPEHNLALSQQRADAVKSQLVTLGVDAARLSTKGFGDTAPISDNSTQEGKANNRRVEFVRK